MDTVAAVQVEGLSHFYGQREALADLSFDVRPGEIFAFLGPNGGGKTTLFRVLCTLVPPQHGRVHILGRDVQRQLSEIRAMIGVVFQAASLDKKLTVQENLRHQAALYGLSRSTWKRRQTDLLEQFGLAGRRHETAETLSGGLRRRVELAKGMIHGPRLLLMDEPSTGLDPGARKDLWQYLCRLRDEAGVTVMLTTHLLDEAEKADRIAIVHKGRLVALDTPDALRATVRGESITIEANQPDQLAVRIAQRFSCDARVVDGKVRLEQPSGHQWIARLVEAFPEQIDSIMLGRPTLEDVFIDRTGHRFWQDQKEVGLG